MLKALLPMILGIVSHTPEAPGATVQPPLTPGNAPAPQFVGLNLPAQQPGTPPAGGVAGGPTTGGGVAPGTSPGEGQPSPSPALTTISEAEFYAVDPNRPGLERVTGAQLREMAHRGRQVDALQSELHSTQNEHALLTEQLRTANARLQQMATQQTVADQLARAGVQPNTVQPSVQPVIQPGAAGVPDPGGDDIYDRLAQEWSSGNAPTAYGYTGQPGQQPPVQPQMQTQPPVQPTQGSALLGDPKALAQELLPLISQLVDNKIGNIDQRIQSTTQAGFEQLQQDNLARNQIASTLSQTRITRSQALQDIGMEPELIQNTVELEDAARVLEREAEGLLNHNTPDNLLLAQEKLRQAALYTQRATDNRTQANVAFSNTQQQRVYEQAIETRPYQAVGLEPPGAPDLNLKDPRAIQQANQDRLNMARQLVTERERIEGAGGVM